MRLGADANKNGRIVNEIEAQSLAARAITRATAGPSETDNGVVLLVESSPLVARLVADTIRSALPYEVQTAATYADAKRLLEESNQTYSAAVVCLALPDAPAGEIVDLTIGAHVPTIVLTGDYHETTREQALSLPLVDYFVKEERSLVSLNFILQRLAINPEVGILVVDDSAVQRRVVRRLLEAHRFNVYEAVDGADALEVIKTHTAISLVITDYEMPKMNGIELVTKLRDKRQSNELAIIGVSSSGIGALSARYLKHGADDFLQKPFEKEEFYCRIYRSLVHLKQIKEIKHAAYTDQLTGLNNRLAFFNTAPARFAETVGDAQPLALGMIDIDHFKRINDTYGHAAGDAALRHLAQILCSTLPDTVFAARFGGEEFCCLAYGATPEEAHDLFDTVRSTVEKSSFDYEGETIRFTLSIGVALFDHSDLDESINRADSLLYEAKQSGRNRVVLEQPTDSPEAPLLAVAAT